MKYRIAHTIDEVVDSWKLVYSSYLENKLIAPNKYGLFTTNAALHSDYTVLYGANGESNTLDCTVSILHNKISELSLYKVYRKELDAFADSKREYAEVGLFASLNIHHNSRKFISDVIGIFQLVFFYGYVMDRDFIIGVHPDHTGFYGKYWGFEVIGGEKSYPDMAENRVVLMHVSSKKLMEEKKVKGVQRFLKNPLDPDIFDNRFIMSESVISGSLLDDFINEKHEMQNERISV